MLTDKELADFIVRFLLKKGEPNGAHHFVPKDIGERVEFYRLFIKSLVHSYGYSEADIKTSQLHKMIIQASHNPGHKDREKKEKWIQICERDWAYAIAYEFEKDDIVDYDFSKEVPRERPVREPRPERPRYTRDETPKEVEAEDDETAILTNPLTDEDRAAMSMGEVDYVVDEEFLKLLEGKDE